MLYTRVIHYLVPAGTSIHGIATTVFSFIFIMALIIYIRTDIYIYIYITLAVP